MLLKEAADLYMEDRSRRLRATTLEGYASALRRHVLPRWGATDLAEIGHEALQEWVDSFELPGAARKAFKTLRQVFRWAVRRKGLRLWDVTQGIELPACRAKGRGTLSAREERRMLSGIEGAPFEAVVVLAASLGLRRCEACGLRWEDVDWRTGEVSVRRGLHWAGGREAWEPCKTRLSERTLRLPRFALARLRAIRGRRRRGRVCPVPPHVAARAFRSWCLSRGLPWVPMSSLRHSWATIALGAGAAIEDVSVALGHSTVDTAIRHYLTSFSAVMRRATESYERAMAGA